MFPSEVGTPMSGRDRYRAFKIRVKRAACRRSSVSTTFGTRARPSF